MNKKIVIITASEIKNLELANNFQKAIETEGAEAKLINLVELDLPLFSSRTQSKFKGEELLKNELPDISNAGGFVFIAPEYNGSTPPVFNNFLAWLSQSSKDWRHHLNGKPATIATFSAGGGLNVLGSMRVQLAYIGMNVLGRQIHTHMSKPLDEKSLQTVVKELIIYSHVGF